MPAHIACRPWSCAGDAPMGCSVVCAAHDLRQSFGTAHAVARAACIEHDHRHHADEERRRVPLLSVISESSATAGFRAADLRDLLTKARVRNRAFGVSGMLLAENGWFLQALEGPEPIVENLMRSIRRDPRHEHVRVLSREVRQHRRFPDWAMAEGHIGEVESRPLEQYSEGVLIARGRTEGRPVRALPDAAEPSAIDDAVESATTAA